MGLSLYESAFLFYGPACFHLIKNSHVCYTFFKLIQLALTNYPRRKSPALMIKVAAARRKKAF